MNIIERYISAYVIHCLFPAETSSETHINYVYEVLRETGSKPKNPLLGQVLDFVRQSDPANPETQKMVRDYVTSRLSANLVPVPKEEGFIARYAADSKITLFAVMKGTVPVAFAGCYNAEIEKCKAELRNQFPGIEFQKI